MTPKKKTLKSLSEFINIEDDLRKMIIKTCTLHGVSRYKLGKIAGIHPIQINWFVSGEKTLSLPTVAKIAKAVKLIEDEKLKSFKKK